MTIRQWSTTASGNANAASINWAEGQAPSTVNNSARELMAQIRQEYDPERWGWVAFSATVSVASQTTFKITGNQTDDYVANRKVKLTGGSATVYADIVSASYTSETTVTIQNASGSLSSSMSIAWLSAVYGNNLPGNILRNGDAASLSGITSTGDLVVNGTRLTLDSSSDIDFYLDKAAASNSNRMRWQTAGSNRWIVESQVNTENWGLARYVTGTFQDYPIVVANSTGNVTIANALSVGGALSLTGGGTVTSATLSVAAGMLTVGGSPVGGGAAGGTAVLNNTAPTTAGATFSGSWSAYSAFEIAIGLAHDPALTSTTTTTLSVGVALYSDGGTTPFLTGTIAQIAPSSTNTVNVWTTVKVAGAGNTSVAVYPASGFVSGKDAFSFTAQPTATSSSGALYVNAIRVWAADSGGTLSFTSTGRVIITGT